MNTPAGFSQRAGGGVGGKTWRRGRLVPSTIAVPAAEPPAPTALGWPHFPKPGYRHGPQTLTQRLPKVRIFPTFLEEDDRQVGLGHGSEQPKPSVPHLLGTRSVVTEGEGRKAGHGRAPRGRAGTLGTGAEGRGRERDLGAAPATLAARARPTGPQGTPGTLPPPSPMGHPCSTPREAPSSTCPRGCVTLTRVPSPSPSKSSIGHTPALGFPAHSTARSLRGRGGCTAQPQAGELQLRGRNSAEALPSLRSSTTRAPSKDPLLSQEGS